MTQPTPPGLMDKYGLEPQYMMEKEGVIPCKCTSTKKDCSCNSASAKKCSCTCSKDTPQKS